MGVFTVTFRLFLWEPYLELTGKTEAKSEETHYAVLARENCTYYQMHSDFPFLSLSTSKNLNLHKKDNKCYARMFWWNPAQVQVGNQGKKGKRKNSALLRRPGR